MSEASIPTERDPTALDSLFNACMFKEMCVRHRDELTALREKLSRYQSAEMPEYPLVHHAEFGAMGEIQTEVVTQIEYDRLAAYCAKLKVEEEQGWKAYYDLRKQLAADKYPNLTNIVRPVDAARSREGKE